MYFAHLLKPYTLSAVFCFAVQSQGAEIVNALALFLLLLLDLFMIGRQERLKCREVERRLQTIIDKINGEVSFICLSFAFVFSSYWIFLQTWSHTLLIELTSLLLRHTETGCENYVLLMPALWNSYFELSCGHVLPICVFSGRRLLCLCFGVIRILSILQKYLPCSRWWEKNTWGCTTT